MCIVFILLKAPVTAKVWKHPECPGEIQFSLQWLQILLRSYFLSLPLNISFWLIQAERDGGRKSASQFGAGRYWESHPGTRCSYLGLRHDGILPRGSAEEGGQRGGDDDWIRPDKATEVTAGDGVLLCLHHQSVHGIKAIPRQPHGTLLAHERGSLKVQGQGGAAIGDQVKPGEGVSELTERGELTCRPGRCSDLQA